MKLVFASRLTYDKGADLIMQIAQKKEFQHIEIHVFGLGEYEEQFVQLSKQYNNLIFHGLVSRGVVQKHIQDCDLVLMPSRVMESFGLSALDARIEQKPVFVRNQGGLAEFLYKGLGFDGDDHFETNLLKAIALIQQSDFSAQFQHYLSTKLHHYSQQQWINNFEIYSQEHKKILVVSDYIYPFGGIENYVIDVNHVLRSHGFVSHLVGNDQKPTSLSRKTDLFLTCCNFFDTVSLFRKIKQYQPNFVFLHSFSRRLGLLPLLLLLLGGKKVVVMLHDFALFCAYPSKIISQQQLRHLGSWKSLYKSDISDLSNFVEVCLKYVANNIYLYILRKSNRKIIVPSRFMQEPIQSVIGKEVGVLNHFGKSL